MIPDAELLSSPVIERREAVKAAPLPRKRMYLLMLLLTATFGAHQYVVGGIHTDALEWLSGRASSTLVEPARPIVKPGPLVMPVIAEQHHAISNEKNLENKALQVNEEVNSRIARVESPSAAAEEPKKVVVEPAPVAPAAVTSPKVPTPPAAVKTVALAKPAVPAQPVKQAAPAAPVKPTVVPVQQSAVVSHEDHSISGCDYLLERGVVTPAEAGLKSMTKDLAQLRNCTVRPGTKLSETETVREINPDLKIVWTNQRVITIVEGGVQK